MKRTCYNGPGCGCTDTSGCWPRPHTPQLSDFDRGCIESMKHNAQRMREECRRQRTRAEVAESRIAELEAQVAGGLPIITAEPSEPCAGLLQRILDGKDSK